MGSFVSVVLQHGGFNLAFWKGHLTTVRISFVWASMEFCYMSIALEHPYSWLYHHHGGGIFANINIFFTF
jgi:hypothetical protein